MADYKTQGRIVSQEGGLSFIPKSWQCVRESADKDLQLIRQRMRESADKDIQLIRQRARSLKEPLRDLANSFDKEWENLKHSSISTTFSDSEVLFQKWKASNKHSLSSPLKLTLPRAQDFGFWRNWEPNLTRFRRSYSNPDFHSHEKEESLMLKPSFQLKLDMFQGSMVPQDRKLSILVGDNQDSTQEHGSFVPTKWLNTWKMPDSAKGKIAIGDWEPIKRLNASLKDIESSAASSNSPAEFFENLKRTELYQSASKNLKFSNLNLHGMKEQQASDVPPLDAMKLLESIIRQSEPVLDQIGIKKEFSDKICLMLQRFRYQDKSLSESNIDTLPASNVAETAAHELDLRIASVLQSTGYQHDGGFWGQKALEDGRTDRRRHVAIFTTASLPWMTGTAVNPLFRAAYLAKNGKRKVTLLVPWLSKKDQELVYPNHMTFESPEEQENYVRQWLEARVGFKPGFNISFYPGKFSKEKRSILAVGDISEFIPDKEADIAVLEEPEHLTWYHHGKRWTKKFQHVIGVVHTNYLEYVKREKNGCIQAFLLKHVNNWVTSIYCNKVIRLSGATQNLPKSTICNVHGVNPKFLEIGQRKATEKEPGKEIFPKGAYYLGKMLWSKGYRELVDLLATHKKELEGLQVDVFGNGEDSKEVQETAQKLGLAINFHPGIDHADDSLHGYKVFINPSVSDVVCTTTAEALAMGKIVVCADHPSNEFFKSFPNCITYRDSQEFVEKVNQAMSTEPLALTTDQRHILSWEAATDRFINCSELDDFPVRDDNFTSIVSSRGKRTMSLSMSMPKVKRYIEDGFALTHYLASGIEAARLASGAIPGSMYPDEEQCRDLGLPPPHVQRPVHSW